VRRAEFVRDLWRRETEEHNRKWGGGGFETTTRGKKWRAFFADEFESGGEPEVEEPCGDGGGWF
jgi:hypothetical protein